MLEGFVGQEIFRIHQARFESEALQYRQSQSASRRSLPVSFRTKLGDAMIRTGCRLAGMDSPTCISRLIDSLDVRSEAA